MDFTLEALKRYLVMQLIETSSMQNSKEIMGDINQNALETAKTMKGITEMFGSRQNYQQQQPNVLNQPNPYYPPQQYQPGFSQQDEVMNFMNQTRNEITGIKNDMNDLKAQIFDGLQSLNHAITQLTQTFGQKKGS